MLKKPTFALGKLLLELHVKVAVLEKLLGVRRGLRVNQLMGLSPRSQNLFKIQTFHGDE